MNKTWSNSFTPGFTQKISSVESISRNFERILPGNFLRYCEPRNTEIVGRLFRRSGLAHSRFDETEAVLFLACSTQTLISFWELPPRLGDFP